MEIGDDFLNVSDGFGFGFLSLLLEFFLLTLQVSVKFLKGFGHL